MERNGGSGSNSNNSHYWSSVECGSDQISRRAPHVLPRAVTSTRMSSGIYNHQSYFLEHEEPESSVAAVAKKAGRMMQVESTEDGCMMIPLINLTTPIEGTAIKTSLSTENRTTIGGDSAVVPKSNQPRSRFFQRALSCDVDIRMPTGGATSVTEEMETTKWDRQGCRQTHENAPEGDETRYFASGDLASRNNCSQKTQAARFAAMAEEEQSLTTSRVNKDSGIVCSDEDLRSILSEVTLSRRLSAEAKRERMKTNRSLSLDSSSFFKLHIRRLQSDSPYWLSRILSQRERRDSGATTNNGSSAGRATPLNGSSHDQSPCASSNTIASAPADDPTASSNDIIRRRAILQSCGKSTGDAATGTPYTISEIDNAPDDTATPVCSSSGTDTDQQSDPATSRRASTVSGCSDDECSLLLVQDSNCGSGGKKHGNINPCAVGAGEPNHGVSDRANSAENSLHVPLSKVVWNESSVVDAELLGHAIEIYLTSVGGGKNDAAVSVSDGGGAGGAASGGGGGGGVVLPMVSTLKGLFVK